MSFRFVIRLLTAVAAVIPQTSAQSLQSPAPEQLSDVRVRPAEYSIVGDVLSPNTWQFPQAMRRVRVVDLLARAGAESRGFVAIFRDSLREPIKREAFDARFPERSTILRPGDCVVFRSESQQVPSVRNALLMFSNGTAHLPLQTGTRGVAELLDQLQVDSTMSVTVCRASVRQVEQLVLSGPQAIRHGDVVDLTHLVLNSDHSARRVDLSPALPPSQPVRVRPVSEGLRSDVDKPEVSQPADDEVLVSLEEASRETLPQAAVRPTMTATGNATRKPVRKSNAGTSPVMNTVFIAGLLFAIGLILVGWVRTSQDEIDAQIEERTLKRLQGGAGADGGFCESSRAMMPEPGVESPDDLLSAEETREYPWVTDDSPVLTAGIERFPAEVELRTPDSLPAAVMPSSFDEAARTNVIDTVPQPIPEISAASGYDMNPQFQSAQNESTASAVNWQELDDLIHNRLTVEVQPASLPMRTTLFGRPAGPVSLRVDAAHEGIASPHMLTRGKRSSKGRRVETVHARVDQPSQQKAVCEELDLSRLDKALNFLEEQSDS